MRARFFYGWVIVAVTFVTMAIGVNARTAFSLFFPSIVDEFHWERGLTAGAFSFGFVAVYGGFAHPDSLIGNLIAYAFISAFLGGLGGLIMGAVGASPVASVGIGIGAGMLYMVIEGVLSQNWGNVINIVFYFFTGRLVGALIGAKIRQPIPR